jgi:predicted secreted Zn-dependent protease
MAGDTSAEAGASSGVGGATADPGSEFCDDPLMTGDTARLAVTESINLYTVEGSSAGEMRASLDLNGPGGYDGQTDWYIQWGYRSCSADGVDVSLDIVYTMPEWDEPASASPELADQWFSFVDLLWCHEFGHTANGLWAANEVLDTLVEALLQDCNNGWSSAQGEVQDILSQANAMDIMYDDETNHGATQGVQFP